MARNGDPRRDDDSGTQIVTKVRPKTKRPSLYKVLLLNDDYTPMDFVVYILERFFNKAPEEATRIMLHVHQKGVGICGVYTYEVAETKVAQVTSFARLGSKRSAVRQSRTKISWTASSASAWEGWNCQATL